ncbi:MAG: hypothetical protein ACKOEE_02635 [Tagaea sp.]
MLTDADFDLLTALDLIPKDADRAGMLAAQALDDADLLATAAWEQPHARGGLQGAAAALAKSAYCASALTLVSLLAARDLDERIRLLDVAVRAGAGALGPALDAEAGKLGASPRGLAYLEARQHLASAVGVKGEREASFAHWREVLRLDPADPAKCRFDFADALIDDGKLDEAAGVLAQAETGPARGEYARAFLAFAAKAPDADAKLDAALKANGFVPAYLVGDRKAPKTSPLEVPPGGREEAAVIAVNAARAWARMDGALAWLRAAKGKAR